MNVRHLKAEDYRSQGWKNGGGVTLELAMEPREEPPVPPEREPVPGLDFLWRLSIAQVERSGPFSDFAGYERTLMLLSGEGMELDFAEAPTIRIDKPEQPFAFDGAWKTTCRLIGGPVTDMNLMVDRQRARGAVRVVELGRAVTMLIAAPQSLYYVLHGEAAFGILGADRIVAGGELLWIDGAGRFPFQARATRPDTAIVEIGIARLAEGAAPARIPQ